MDEYEILTSNEYSKAYSEKSFFDKLIKNAKKAGIKVVYAGLILFYTMKKPLTPKWAKATILGALGYFISPIDAIVDITPVAGYTDDLGALILAIAAVAIFIDDKVKDKARTKLREWFGNFDDSLLEDINKKIDSSK
ncbi:YkvA family protein [Clostridium cellulovorans]|uniref:DUF1232 domain-containing protein n=1 Tax=Clostridium cellulovorans (strain ATCC 35296 / DSM 3052 / OCM 3 / 743B) TaxID=573061 RepID=D9SQR6_CLOC7|nr:DUF1232 domain-containing protein [Clostridium cellulovorans]ADL52272.1 protein of unknown function DUF1232 [Clostridium cellulovorans 743B]